MGRESAATICDGLAARGRRGSMAVAFVQRFLDELSRRGIGIGRT
jgi:hypothetical protein